MRSFSSIISRVHWSLLALGILSLVCFTGFQIGYFVAWRYQIAQRRIDQEELIRQYLKHSALPTDIGMSSNWNGFVRLNLDAIPEERRNQLRQDLTKAFGRPLVLEMTRQMRIDSEN